MNPSLQANLQNTLGYGNGLGGKATATPNTPGPWASGYNFGQAPAAADPYAAQLAASQAETTRLAQEAKNLQTQLNAAPRLLSYDYAGNAAKARQQAAGAVNPIYQKKLNDYLGQATTNQQRQTEDYNTTISNYDNAYNQLLQNNDISRARTTQDTQNNVDQINNQSDQYQQDSGTNFDQSRLALLRGTQDAGQGLGAQQVAQQQQQRNTQEGRQAQSFAQSKDQQQLLKARTFEDLARAADTGKQQTDQGKTVAKTAFDRYLQDYNVDLTGGKQYGTAIQGEMSQEALDRENAINQTAGQYYGNSFNQYINTLKGARGQDLQLLKSLYGGYVG